MEGECKIKARKGLIKVRLRLNRSGVIENATIAGDFFIYPEDALQDLERAVIGSQSIEEASRKLREVFEKNRIESIGSSVDDFIKALECAYSVAARGR